jgi:hypothetical protein
MLNHANHGHYRLLGARYERPRRRATEKRDEIAPSHCSIRSSRVRHRLLFARLSATEK